MSALIYWPFVRFSERRKRAAGNEKMRQLIDQISVEQRQHRHVLDRHDDVGHAARKFMREFMQDLGTERVFLAYQPQHDRNDRIVGVEALLRWNYRDGLFFPAAVVCALAEEGGFITQVGHWVIETACCQFREWKASGICCLRMSINLSPLQLKDAELLAVIETHLQRNGLSPRELGIELTESQDVPDDDAAGETLNALRVLGLHLEMDDFGMGYSSMLYIRRFDFETIKLDGSLTRDVLVNRNCRDIIASVVQLARALGMRVIAEYVESDGQRDVLAQLGCDAFQGYLYSPALDGLACLDYLRQWSVSMDTPFPVTCSGVRSAP